jgi:hypothetical protein
MIVSLADHYACILEASVRRARGILRNQITDSSSLEFGGFLNYQDGLAHPGSGPGSLLTLVPAFVHRDSELRGDEDLRQRIRMVFDYCDRIQREDGTFDLLTTNFYSSPDNGFIMHNLARTWRLLEAAEATACPDCAKIKERLYKLIERTAAGMIRGGFHTPNHRWVIAAALALSHNITGKAELKTVADQYLAEGIDCDEDGEYTERSSGIYNAVNDNALIILAEELERPELLVPVVRNLEMMFTYFEPDGSVFTWNSTRQDNASDQSNRVFPIAYYHIYLMMLRKTGDPRYAWMAESIFKKTGSGEPPSALWLYMTDPDLQTLESPAEPPATDYEKLFVNSGIARIRKGDLGITLMENSSSFLFLSTPALNLRMKMCASFFGKAQVIPQHLRRVGEGYQLVFKTTGDYRLPLDPPPETSDWRSMDHSRREHVRVLDLEVMVEVLPLSDGVEIEIETEGCERVPVKLEFVLDDGCLVFGESFVIQGNPGQGITATSGTVTARKGDSAFEIGPAFGLHHYTETMRGSEPPSRNGFTLYFTDSSPLRRRVKIRKTGQSA